MNPMNKDTIGQDAINAGMAGDFGLSDTRLQEAIGTGCTFQMRSAYSRIERSLLKAPQRAVFSTDMRRQRSGSRQTASTSFWARR